MARIVAFFYDDALVIHLARPPMLASIGKHKKADRKITYFFHTRLHAPIAAVSSTADWL
jgi:hypothetical protein